MTDNQLPHDPAVAEHNLERLLEKAYRPEAPDPAFARRVEEQMAAAARARAGESPRALRVPVLRRRLVWVLAAAASFAGLAFLFYQSLRPLPQPAADGGSGSAEAPGQPEALPGQPDDDPDRPAPQPRGVRPPLHGERLIARRLPEAPPADALAVGKSLRTGAGQRKRVALPDGSTLYLNQKTAVTLTAARRVTLAAGEVFVEVAPRPPGEGDAARFVVKTPKREVVALGTKFEVSAFDVGTGVLVTQGKVRVDGLDALLTAGQQLAPGARAPAAAPRAAAALDWARELMCAAEAPLVPPSRYAGGALVVNDAAGPPAQLSLRKYHVDVHVEDGFARTTVDQTYFNADQRRLEGTFYFPLPADASLSRLAMYVNGTLNEGGMAERDFARQTFESIVRKMRDPALLEWVDGSTFKMRVFPLEPRQEKRIVLSYTQRLPVQYGRTSYRFPAGHSLESVRDWSFHALVKGGAKWAWASDTHGDLLAAKAEKGDLLLDAGQKDVKVSGDVALDLYPDGKAPRGDESARFSTADYEGAKYLMVRYRPELPAVKGRQRRDWVFLFESSGDRDPLLARTQIEVVRTLLDNAEHDDTFAVVTAGTRARAFAAEAKPATAENVREAVQFLEGTHLVGALDLGAALATAEPFLKSARDPYLVHVGGGLPVVGETKSDVLAKRIPEGVRYVGVAVGKRWNRSLMKGAAERSGGFFAQINPDEPVNWRTFELYSALTAPRLLNVKVIDDAEKVQFLSDTSAVAQGEEVCAVARLGGAAKLPAAVTVSGTLDGKTFTRTVPVQGAAPNAGYLPRTWAKLEIDRLLAEDAVKNKARVIQLSLAMYVMTPYTSLLVLENEQMYQQFGVDRGRKDHWAMYPCPPTIPVVYEPLGAPPAAPAPAPAARPAADAVLNTIIVRIPPALLRPGDGPAPRAATARDLYNGSFAVPLSAAAGLDEGEELDNKFQRRWRYPNSDDPRQGVGKQSGGGEQKGGSKDDSTGADKRDFPDIKGKGEWKEKPGEPRWPIDQKGGLPPSSPPPIPPITYGGSFPGGMPGYAPPGGNISGGFGFGGAGGFPGSTGTGRTPGGPTIGGQFGGQFGGGQFGGQFGGGSQFGGQLGGFGGALVGGGQFSGQYGGGIGGGGFGGLPAPATVSPLTVPVSGGGPQSSTRPNGSTTWTAPTVYFLKSRDGRRLTQEEATKELLRLQLERAPKDRLRDDFYYERQQSQRAAGDEAQLRQLLITEARRLDGLSKRDLPVTARSLPAADVWSGQSLNDAVAALKVQLDAGNAVPLTGIDEGALRHVNVVSADGGNAALLMSDAWKKWPALFAEADYATDRAALGALVEKAIGEVRTGSSVGKETVERLRKLHAGLTTRLTASINEVTPTQYIEAKRYLNALGEAVTALASPDVRDHLGGRFVPRGRTVAELVKHMTGHGLRFAPALPGDEAAYLALYAALTGPGAPAGAPAGRSSVLVGLRPEVLLYRRPAYAFDGRLFTDLPAFAPGLNTSRADVLGVLEAEAEPDPADAPGTIDAAARALVEGARAEGWRKVTIPASGGVAAYAVAFDGSGRYACERVLPCGLKEQVVCDGKELLHLYPELGLGARRKVTRFHRAEFADLVPWALPSAKELAHGADVKAVDEHTVALLPRDSRDGDAGVVVQLVFADFRLVERRLVEMPGKAVLRRETYAADGTVKVLDGAGKVLSSRKLAVKAAAAPDLEPELKTFVVVPLPLRTLDWVLRQPGANNGDPATMDKTLMLARLMAEVAAGSGVNATGWEARFPDDRTRLGFLALFLAAGCDVNSAAVPPKLAAEPLARYLAWLKAPDQAPEPGREFGDGLLRGLVEAQSILRRWRQPGALSEKDCARVLKYVRAGKSPAFAWAVVEEVLRTPDRKVTAEGGRAQLQRDVLKAAAEALKDVPGLAYAARYEFARHLSEHGERAEARKLFLALYEESAKGGALPPLDAAFRQALKGDGKGPDGFAKLMRATAARLVKDGRRTAAVALACQCWQLEAPGLADEVLGKALAGLTDAERGAPTMAAIDYLMRTHQDDRADGLVQELLANPAFTQHAGLWRLGHRLALQRKQAPRAFACLAQALELEYRAAPEWIDVEAVRRDYESLLRYDLDVIGAAETLGQKPPAELAAKAVRAADRWRALDPDNATACDLAARVLAGAGETDLAWDYLLTPSAAGHAPVDWVRLAWSLVDAREPDLADRAFAQARAADPGNADLVRARAYFLLKAGKPGEARKLWPAAGEDDAPPRPDAPPRS